MEEDILKNIINGNYEEAKKKYEQMNWDTKDTKEYFLNLAYDTESICIYSFVSYMMFLTDSIFWIELAAELMAFPLCHLEGAYSVSLHHTRELLVRERNVEHLQMLTLFYDIPEKLIDKEELNYIVNEIIKLDPNNKSALRYRDYK